MTVTFHTAIFNDDDKAREALEAVRWPDGPVCSHCSATRKMLTACSSQPACMAMVMNRMDLLVP